MSNCHIRWKKGSTKIIETRESKSSPVGVASFESEGTWELYVITPMTLPRSHDCLHPRRIKISHPNYIEKELIIDIGKESDHPTESIPYFENPAPTITLTPKPAT